jgi:hypothetical protein
LIGVRGRLKFVVPRKIEFQRSQHAGHPMRLTICKQTINGEVWLTEKTLRPKWGAYDDALHFQSAIEAGMTFKFLPRADRRSASVVDWPILPRLPFLMTGT